MHLRTEAPPPLAVHAGLAATATATVEAQTRAPEVTQTTTAASVLRSDHPEADAAAAHAGTRTADIVETNPQPDARGSAAAQGPDDDSNVTKIIGSLATPPVRNEAMLQERAVELQETAEVLVHSVQEAGARAADATLAAAAVDSAATPHSPEGHVKVVDVAAAAGLGEGEAWEIGGLPGAITSPFAESRAVDVGGESAQVGWGGEDDDDIAAQLELLRNNREEGGVVDGSYDVELVAAADAYGGGGGIGFEFPRQNMGVDAVLDMRPWEFKLLDVSGGQLEGFGQGLFDGEDAAMAYQVSSFPYCVLCSILHCKSMCLDMFFGVSSIPHVSLISDMSHVSLLL